MIRTHSPNKGKALKAIAEAPDRPTQALVACAYALLEVAFQVGRVADFLPGWGPPEEK